jgi:hypothetical protein
MAAFHKTKLPTPVEVITLDNVGSLSTYDIRQELNRREAMDIPDEKVNHKSLLKRLIVELVKDKEREVNEKEEQRAATLAAERAEAQKIREAKKLEAIERSKARQAAKGAEYFAEKAKLNETLKQEKEHKLLEARENPIDDSPVEVIGEDEAEEINNEGDDPFRSKRKFKVAVK